MIAAPPSMGIQIVVDLLRFLTLSGWRDLVTGVCSGEVGR